jgi:hypothetical protein
MFPFGIQIKGFIAGLLFAYLIIPFIQSRLAGRVSKPPA